MDCARKTQSRFIRQALNFPCIAKNAIGPTSGIRWHSALNMTSQKVFSTSFVNSHGTPRAQRLSTRAASIAITRIYVQTTKIATCLSRAQITKMFCMDTGCSEAATALTMHMAQMWSFATKRSRVLIRTVCDTRLPVLTAPIAGF